MTEKENMMMNLIKHCVVLDPFLWSVVHTHSSVSPEAMELILALFPSFFVLCQYPSPQDTWVTFGFYTKTAPNQKGHCECKVYDQLRWTPIQPTEGVGPTLHWLWWLQWHTIWPDQQTWQWLRGIQVTWMRDTLIWLHKQLLNLP